MSSRRASNTCLSWARVLRLKVSWLIASASVLRSSSSSRLASSRSFMKARTTHTDTSTARGVLSTAAAMIAPCSVNARGSFRRRTPQA